MKAAIAWSSNYITSKGCDRLTTSIAYDPVAIAGIVRCRITEVAGSFDASIHELSSFGDKVYNPWC